MIKYNFIKILTAGVALATAIYPQVFACEEGKINLMHGAGFWCEPASGSCGTGCNYSVDSGGNLRIWGNGAVRGYFDSPDFVNVTIEEGITGIGEYAFAYSSSIQSVSLPTTLTTLSEGAFAHTSNTKERIVIPENTQLGGANNKAPKARKIYCAATNADCSKIANPYLYEKDGDNYVVYKDDQIIEVFGSFDDFNKNKLLDGTYTKRDENGNPIASYSNTGTLLAQYALNPDGSTSIYDANGKLTGLKNAKSITPAQAAALVKKGNHNKVTLTFK